MTDKDLHAVVDVPGIHRQLNFALHSANDRYISHDISVLGEWEPLETEVVVRLLNPGAVFVDCGANLGWYTVIAAAYGATVIAFEPEPNNLRLLRANIEANDVSTDVTVHPVGLGRRAGSGRLSLSDENQGDHQLGERPDRPSIEIEVVTLDAALEGVKPRMLKLDTQGSEVAILDGGAQTLAGMRSYPAGLILEFWPMGLKGAGSTAGELIAHIQPLLEQGYRCFEIDERTKHLRPRRLEELTTMSEVGDFSTAMGGHTNLLLVKEVDRRRLGDLVDDSRSPAESSQEDIADAQPVPEVAASPPIDPSHEEWWARCVGWIRRVVRRTKGGERN